MSSVSPLRVAQITDIHLFADRQRELLGLPTADSFGAVLQRLTEIRSEVDLILLTGDLSQDGTPESYAQLQSRLIPLGIPTYWLPGNHDNPITMRQILYQAPILPQKAFRIGIWQFILLNSGVPGRVHGYLSPESLDWLDSQLQLSRCYPTTIALHHPPFLVESAWLDTSTLQNSAQLFAVLDRYPQVKLVLFGHIHQEFTCQQRGVHYLGAPSTSIQFEPKSSQFSLDQTTPGFRLLNLYADGTWDSRVERTAYNHQLNLAASGY
ncbi:phosphodiesterase [Leptolyngbya sp. 'hensonii']|uniref:3',5'-cyclic-AMP phosphodiesterase n=1 Tax=Leptolyngbya sp. 'hensonii' TaxID=1922337 RepID=UPI00094F5BAD|nr:3',5'-cyclic-AMP phosphodiesterase [Leptolyngbya sp. 'hensonii']OLP15460.1 phosphodiesterase [Leptolyngbya sp. 'hensonii']